MVTNGKKIDLGLQRIFTRIDASEEKDSLISSSGFSGMTDTNRCRSPRFVRFLGDTVILGSC